jgi:predicted lipoprotein with Yx(FWY)xxD motif
MKIPKAIAVVAAALTVGIVAAGCGGSSSSSAAPGGGTSASASGSGHSGYGYGSPAASTSAVTVKTASSPLGTILVDQDGKTLYLFEADSKNTSNCSGGCLAVWPPVTAKGAATAGNGATASMIGTTMDGSSQVTYAGHPLYWFSGDAKAGDTNGEGLTDFGGAWYAVSPAGKAVEQGG